MTSACQWSHGQYGIYAMPPNRKSVRVWRLIFTDDDDEDDDIAGGDDGGGGGIGDSICA